MAVSQPAIVADAGPFALYVLFKVTGSASAVLGRSRDVHTLVDDINSNQPGSNMKAAVSFTPAFCQANNIVTPDDFTPFQALGEGDTHAPATDCDVLLHVHSTRHDLNFYLLRKFLENIGSDVTVVDETYGYRYLDSRDMTGFIDGTENPEGEDDRRAVAIIADGECAGGSVVMMQRYVHRLNAWEPLSVKQQEKIIGRTKSDSIELDDVPATSHVGRVDIKEDGKGLKMVRHSLPYGSVSGDHGLLFIAYCHTQHVHKTMLESMFGERDGKTDMMLRFTTPVTGAYFFAPSMDALSKIA
ncbi:deferrochelatase [Enterovibrio norvegicus]|uniref:Putative iron-dependent peroxidase n=1 Tax=Enterovibrio norvegicus DSM 15893 TaxID=1121869 RepID=A0A1I5TUH5_9GAMM|nr:Dyp-type peroxidase [Enterovibrio norvegicus]MCC4799002.1 Dyp-type peroxidase [Enterovibrio norvegicus]PMI29360.1 deferrochelatase [Enterovibrio norvegicus]PMI37861.1 deferrochelatase [Enterovibrio norvegicus]PMN46450.1 deferrochelatase [Enterovibrio norvegicus]TKF10940.1 Dyp-type peroxidase [Enterovibrio norvegicus]